MKKTLICIFALLLNACGGGGGSSTAGSPLPASPTSPPAPAVSNDPCLTLSPSPLNLTLVQGTATPVRIDAKAHCDFPGVINVAVIDNKGVFAPKINVTALTAYDYVAQLQTSATLPTGSYDGILEVRLCKDDPTVCSQQHKGSPWQLPYHVQVNQPVSWSVQNPPALVADGNAATGTLTTKTAINLSGTASVQWHASVADNAPWLKLANASGTTNASSLQVTVDPAEFAKLPNFADYTAVVTISTDFSDIPPTTIAITLKKAIAAVSDIGPYTLLPLESATVHLRGHGFSALKDLSRLQISGINVSNVQIVSDSEITMTASAGMTGAANFSVSNSMGVDTGSATLKIIAPASYGYHAFATAGYKGTLRFDAERKALLLVNREQLSVLRYAYAGNGWASSSAAVAGADDAALSADGKSLVVTSTSGRLSLLDPVTLTLQSSYQGGTYKFGAYVSSRLAVTNDGRAWFPQGDQWNSLAYFDLHTHQFGQQGTSYYGGPWFSLSGDGERLVFTQSAAVSPPPPVQYMDGADGIIRNTPDENFSFFYTASQNRDGSRMVFDDYLVRDKAFAVLGKLVAPAEPYASFYSYGSVISPDGARTYVMYIDLQANATLKPRIYVFDTSRSAGGNAFPVLGYFDVPDSPTSCATGDYCDPRMSTAITPDGTTLFFAGNKMVLVVPVPSTLSH
jgi:hypothetical protein